MLPGETSEIEITGDNRDFDMLGRLDDKDLVAAAFSAWKSRDPRACQMELRNQMPSSHPANRLILHIGMHKAGSTAIQSGMWKHRDILANHGIDYLDFTANHSSTVAGLFSQSNKGIYRGFPDEEQRIADGYRRLRQLLEHRPLATTVISGERFSLLREPEVHSALDFFDQYFAEIYVVAFVRPPRSFVNSIVQQRLKSGRSIDYSLSRPKLPNYRVRFETYLDRMGPAGMTFIPFDSEGLTDGCSFRSLLTFLDLPRSTVETIPVWPRNQSLSLTGVRIVNELNRRGVEIGTGDRKRYLVRQFKRIKGPKFVLPEVILDRCVAECGPDIDWMNTTLGRDIRDHDLVGSSTGMEVFEITDAERPTLEQLLQKIQKLDRFPTPAT